jgi:uncharacterized membrane protein
VRTLYLAAVWLHVLSAMTWIGGMVVVAAAVLPQVRRLEEPHQSSFRWNFFGRFRITMWTAYLVAGLTGTLVLGLRGVRASDFFSAEWLATPFGHVMAMKLALYVAGGAITLWHERVHSPARARLLGRLTMQPLVAADRHGTMFPCRRRRRPCWRKFRSFSASAQRIGNV